MINIILCGGSGTRLWPISRTLLPKQFVKLFGNRSLFQLTLQRNNAFCQNACIVSNTEQYFLAIDQIEELSEINYPTNFLLEPVGRNTAPAIALATMLLDPDEIVLVTPSDHLINDEAAYALVIEQAKEFANSGSLVTFGIKPTSAETGFGYIEANGFDVIKFHEKPDQSTANKYLETGSYFWNSGMFCFKAGVFLGELQKYSPEIFKTSSVALENAKQGQYIRIKKPDMQNIPADSIDYAVMEQSQSVKVVPADIGWSDMGSFESLNEELPVDGNGNAFLSTGNWDEDVETKKLVNAPISIDSKNNLLISSGRQISTIDVEDLIIVDTPDALLVCKKGSGQKVKEVVKKLKENNSDLHNIHLTSHRPWGNFTVLEESHKYKIKRINVKPGKKLSLQKHFHRNEHWVVVSGTAKVTNGDDVFLVRANESTYIPMGCLHRLENPGKIDLVLIEAQVGEYLGEDDIVRIEDDYHRDE